MTGSRPLVVLGAGPAGLNALAAVVRRAPGRRAILIDSEERIGYYRPLLPAWMLGQTDEEKLFFCRPDTWDTWPGVETILGVEAVGLDRAAGRLLLSDGRALDYHRLIIATGGRPFIPPVCRDDSCRLGVWPVRSLAAAEAVRGWLADHHRVAVLGGGLVGVKTAAHFLKAGRPVSLIEREGRLMPNILAPEPAEILAGHLRALGADLHLGATVERIRADAGGGLNGVLVNGRWLAVETLLSAIGSRPEIGFLGDSGLLEQGRLIVDTALRTKDGRILAAGDAVTVRDPDGSEHQPWTWPQAVVQGRLAGENALRANPARLARLTRVNAQNVAGLALVSLGALAPGMERLSALGQAPTSWRELCLQPGGRAVSGGSLVGDISAAGPLHFALGGPPDRAVALLRRPRAIMPASLWDRLGAGPGLRTRAPRGEGQ